MPDTGALGYRKPRNFEADIAPFLELLRRARGLPSGETWMEKNRRLGTVGLPQPDSIIGPPLPKPTSPFVGPPVPEDLNFIGPPSPGSPLQGWDPEQIRRVMETIGRTTQRQPDQIDERIRREGDLERHLERGVAGVDSPMRPAGVTPDVEAMEAQGKQEALKDELRKKRAISQMTSGLAHFKAVTPGEILMGQDPRRSYENQGLAPRIQELEYQTSPEQDPSSELSRATRAMAEMAIGRGVVPEGASHAQIIQAMPFLRERAESERSGVEFQQRQSAISAQQAQVDERSRLNRESREKIARESRDFQVKRRGEDIQERALETVEKDEVVGQARKVIRSGNELRQALKAGSSTGDRAALNLWPRVLGDVGVLSNQDIQRHTYRIGLINQIKDRYNQGVIGELSADHRAEMLDLLDTLEGTARQTISGRVKGVAESRSKIYGVDQGELEGKLRSSFGLKRKVRIGGKLYEVSEEALERMRRDKVEFTEE